MDSVELWALVGVVVVAIAVYIEQQWGQARLRRRREAWWQSGGEARLPRSGPRIGTPTRCLVRDPAGPAVAILEYGRQPQFLQPGPLAAKVREKLDAPGLVFGPGSREHYPRGAAPDTLEWWQRSVDQALCGHDHRQAEGYSVQWQYPEPLAPREEI